MAAVNHELDGDIAILTIDNPPVNALSYPVRVGLHDGIAQAIADPKVKAVVLLCAGRTFSAGADITEFGREGGPQEPRIRRIVIEIEASTKPVIAALHGTALGGGLELAMSCHWRIARRDAKFGLPEVNIGVIPGGGGTQRLPRLVGPAIAMEIITSGKHFPAEFGLEHGLLDELTDADLRSAAVAFARRMVREGRRLRVTSQMNDKIRNVDPRLFADARQKIQRRAQGQLAPWKCIEGVEIACRESFEAGTRFEEVAFEQCRSSPQRGALTHLFKAEREARKIPGSRMSRLKPCARRPSSARERWAAGSPCASPTLGFRWL